MNSFHQPFDRHIQHLDVDTRACKYAFRGPKGEVLAKRTDLGIAVQKNGHHCTCRKAESVEYQDRFAISRSGSGRPAFQGSPFRREHGAAF